MTHSVPLRTLSALALATLLTFPAVAQRPAQTLINAQIGAEPRLAPTVRPRLVPDGPRHPLPRFGMHTFNNGYGEQVTRVRPGGLAWRLGLERGDTIVRLNRYPLNYRGAWWDALDRAMERGGNVRLTVRDSRTGYLVKRYVDLGHELGWQHDLGHVEPRVVARPIAPPVCEGPFPVEPDYPIGGPIGGPATPKFRGGQKFVPTPAPAPRREVPTARRKIEKLIGLASLLSN